MAKEPKKEKIESTPEEGGSVEGNEHKGHGKEHEPNKKDYGKILANRIEDRRKKYRPEGETRETREGRKSHNERVNAALADRDRRKQERANKAAVENQKRIEAEKQRQDELLAKFNDPNSLLFRIADAASKRQKK